MNFCLPHTFKVSLVFGIVLWATEPVQANAARSIPATDIPKFLQVNENLFRGGRPTQNGLNILKQKGIRSILNLENVPEAVATEKANAKRLSLKFLNVPMTVYAAPLEATMTRTLEFLRDAKNFPIYVHCLHGEDRTGLVIGLYRYFVDKWPAQEAYNEMLSAGFHPQYVKLDEYFRLQTNLGN